MDYPCHKKAREFWCDRDGPGGFMGHTCVPIDPSIKLREHIKAHLHWGPLRGDDKLRFMVLALCGEAGELANLVKKDWRGDVGNRRNELIEELADVANYTYMIAEALGIDLQAEMLTKLEAVEERPSWKAHLSATPQ